MVIYTMIIRFFLVCYQITVNRKNGKGIKAEPLLLKDGKPVARGFEAILGFMIPSSICPDEIQFTNVDAGTRIEIKELYRQLNNNIPFGTKDIASPIRSAVENYEDGFRFRNYPTEPEIGYGRLL